MEYCVLLRRIRAGTTTMDDYLTPIDRVGTKTLTLANGHQAYKVIVRSNQLRQHINVTSVFEFARSRNQPLFIFMAAHHCTDASVKVDDWRSLAVVDYGSNSPGPIMIKQSLYTSLGIVNGKKVVLCQAPETAKFWHKTSKKATAVDFALDESANVYSFGDNTVPFLT